METATILGLDKHGEIVTSVQRDTFELPWQLERGERWTECRFDEESIVFKQPSDFMARHGGVSFFLATWLVFAFFWSFACFCVSVVLCSAFLFAYLRAQAGFIPFELTIRRHISDLPNASQEFSASEIESLVVRTNVGRDIAEDSKLVQLLIRFHKGDRLELVYQQYFPRENVVLCVAQDILEWLRDSECIRLVFVWNRAGKRIESRSGRV